MTKYIELSVEINPIWAEYVSDVLINQVGCSGVVTEELEYKDEKVISAKTGVVIGYLWLNVNQAPNIEEIQDILDKNKQKLINSNIKDKELGSWKVHIDEVEDEEWAHSWKRFWHPQKIGSKIIICPSWETCDIAETEIKIELDPGTAFGTGTHPTTRLCIMALEKYAKEEDEIADIGMGSGILSIVGAKLGAKNVVGVDNDPSVVEIAIENAVKNSVDDKCSFYEGSAEDVQGKFQIVVANILAEVIVSIMDNLISLVNKEGRLILSGIIVEKADMVKQAVLLKGFKITEILEEDNWVAIIAER
ncbi:MAG: ribosomal protein L11 methyltransferase [Candidatus Melainabacteria bacterium RIFOXYA12_FULL_32_12]|nr:MAG: ribosomal protein L11 methyltransferase [Candidatus Melainabacteria bacterium RIFOXYA2_FULL_32_9]OGI28174.1 MAG: ribosomal protein L11 methyltransferase [Candidatus Melainabacteria bacterium RIFOXYA12_FULL_32_12]